MESSATSRPDTAPPKPGIVRKLEARREGFQEHGRIYRTSFAVAGVILTLGGIAMLVLPGPAFLVIPIGLAILSLQFSWAASLLDKSLVRADAAKRKAAETSTRQRIVTGMAVACGAGAIAAWAAIGDVPVAPV